MDFTSLQQYPHLIFDLDGTLVDLQIDWTGFGTAFRAHIATFDPDIVTEYPSYNFASIHLYNAVIRKHSIQGKQLVDDFCLGWETDKYQGFIPDQKLITWITTHRSRHNFHIWSSNNRRTIDRVLAETKLSRIFGHIIAKEEAWLNKPEPDGFARIFLPENQLNQYCLIGDSRHDQDAASAAGIAFVSVAE